ncbi:CFA/I fimbrial subunit C [Serratia fonticola]|nr:CFA/I fimbrial subunit C [Serratia fonticola]
MALGMVCFVWCMGLRPFTVQASVIELPVGFEEIFNAQQNEIFDFIYSGASIGSFTALFDNDKVMLDAPQNIFEQLTAADMPALSVDRNKLLKELSAPLKRVAGQEFGNHSITVWINSSDASLHLLLPAEYFSSSEGVTKKNYITYKKQSGFVHNHNANFLADSYGDSFTFSSVDTLNLTGNSYLKGAWSYSKEIKYHIDELTLYFEKNSTRFKAGRQRINDNYTYSTPSLRYSFFNPLSFDGISVGYMTDNYLDLTRGAASGVTVFLPQSGTVEIYANGKMIDLQQLPPGLQTLNTDSWPMGGYDVQLVTILTNGARETKIQPFFKRSGMFRSGDLEYTLQVGSYDREQSNVISSRNYECVECMGNQRRDKSARSTLASFAAGYTTSSVVSFGGGALLDYSNSYLNGNLDIPVDSWVAEQLHTDFIIGNDGSYGYQLGMNKNLNHLGLNLSYRSHRYRGDEPDYRRQGAVPAYDFNFFQLGATTFIPWNIGLSATYSMNTQYQQYKMRDKNNYNSWDISLNRDMPLSHMMNLRVELGYHQASNKSIRTLAGRDSLSKSNDDRFFANFTLGFREQSFNHYQTLNLRGKLSDNPQEKADYSTDYAVDLYNPDFDRSGIYSLSASASQSQGNQRSAGGSLLVDNNLGYSSAGIVHTLGSGSYNQYYFSQRSGFAIGDNSMAWGKTDNTSALIIDATELPRGQYFEINNRDSQGVVVMGGKKTTLNIQPYRKILPIAEQLFNDEINQFYNLSTRSASTWALPGQVYNVKLMATKNQTVTGRVYSKGYPLPNARIVGGNAITDSEGYFVGDFILNIHSQLGSLKVEKDGIKYQCPLQNENIKLTHGVMQIREVQCEVKS